ncbi:stage V sporulation protein AB [Kineothrix alysoides]|uniref:Stage V sporulation protein AB n=1 Tax=Kineothrix alysoides TaxID=1469948 RepID=A0A4R1R4Y9_9FIRM|nr:stage V sporulation protein AB [Kineothrix alysoides]TCL60480.1 stage V sporulation protein AB [Kineothrix alysoides]
MFLKQLLLGIMGLSFGMFAAGGVFTVLISVGLIPRFAGKMHVSRKIFLFEEAVVLGTLTGNFFSIFDRYGRIGDFIIKNHIFGKENTESIWHMIGTGILIIFGLFAGIFVGCLALAIAEMLNSIPIFARRIGFRHGLGVVVLAMALGKIAGGLIYFIKAVFLYGGT